jgi:hypothetical protein
MRMVLLPCKIIFANGLLSSLCEVNTSRWQKTWQTHLFSRVYAAHIIAKAHVRLLHDAPIFVKTTFDSDFGTQNDACCDPVLSK